MIIELALSAILAGAQQEPELLPPSPEGWRFERLELPLGFAPDIPFTGWEELWFAPGMFEAGADDYFSYVLAFKLNESVDLEVPELEDILTRYYRGLCRAVGGQELDYDYDSIRADVQRKGEAFTATIDMVDAFVTKKPLRLSFELIEHAIPGGTELFGIASPAKRDAKIWSELEKMRDAWRAARPTPVFLNHLYMVPDQATFDAIQKSEYLRDAFCVAEERTTVRGDLSYSGVYFYGQKTYFEFLPPGKDQLTQGNTGVAFGLESLGATKDLGERLKERNIVTFAGPMTRELNGEQLPWFDIMGVQMPMAKRSVSLFTMEYSLDFLKRWHGELAPRAGGISRASVLERYAAKLDPKDERAKLPLLDIDEVTLELVASQAQRFAQTCDVFGYDVEEPQGSDLVWTIEGPRVRYRIRAVDEARGVVGFRMKLREEVKREPLQLGAAEMRFEGDHAIFELRIAD